MSSFKSYGKVDEQDQMLHETQMKTRKRIIIISLSSIILVGVVLAAVFGILNNSRDDNNSSQQHGGSAVATSVKAICDVTLYKESCYSSLSSIVNGEVQPEELLKLSIKVALEEVSNVVNKYFSSSGGHNGHFQGLNNFGREKEALDNCGELLDLAVDHLNNSLSSVEASSLFDIFDDIQTWLSASGTYQQTCIEGFDEAKESLKLIATNYLKNSTEFTSNSLAIITWIKKAAATAVVMSRRRLLTSSSLPEWLHSNDRMLLGTNNSINDLKWKKETIVVAKDGSGKYKRISDALKHVPDKSNKRTVIYVKRGVYYENVRVEKNKWNVMIIGDGMNATIVSASRNFVDGTTTFSTATFAVFGKNFIARDMGFRNTAGPEKHQAVALMTIGDEAVYYRCHIDAFQDTLYAHSNRQFYTDCNIYGTVDFIFGNSAVVFQNCNIFPKLPIHGQQNTITAQGKTDPNMNTGISIHNCKIREFGNLSSVQTYLGRPWKNYSTTVYIRSKMEAIVDPKGWLPWVGNSAPDTIFYAEFENSGPGASTSNRVKWKGLRDISFKQASKFSVKNFLGGQRWIPASSAPFKSDL